MNQSCICTAVDQLNPDCTPSTCSNKGDWECVAWSCTSTGVNILSLPEPIDVNVQNFPTSSTGNDIHISSIEPGLTFPTTLEGTDNRVMLDNYTLGVELPVNVQNFPEAATGAQLVQLDPAFYPIPTIEQGTAPVEITFESGATLETTTGPIQLSPQAKTDILTLSTGIVLFMFSLAIVLKAYWHFLVKSFRYLTKKLWF